MSKYSQSQKRSGFVTLSEAAAEAKVLWLNNAEMLRCGSA
jgi:hypothetical protein